MIIAWIGALFVGIVLGLLGSGGSILTIPILIYLVGEPEKAAIAESLCIVAAISFAGFLPNMIKKHVHWKSVVLFGVPGMGGSYLGALASSYVSSDTQLLILAGVILLAAVMMYRDSTIEISSTAKNSLPWWIMIIEGFAVGILTGLIGVGGGFLIVPALVLLGKIPMRLAIGSSLAIITMQSTVGFVKQLDVLSSLNISVNIRLMIIFGLIGAAGSLVGKTVGVKIPTHRLKKGFAVFLILMGGFIVYMNV